MGKWSSMTKGETGMIISRKQSESEEKQSKVSLTIKKKDKNEGKQSNIKAILDMRDIKIVLNSQPWARLKVSGNVDSVDLLPTNNNKETQTDEMKCCYCDKKG